jgi:hypothetical protein
LSDLGIAIYDPNTGGANGTGRTPFPGETIPAGRISAPVKNLLAALPMPNLTPTNPAAPNYDASGATLNAPGPFGLYGGQPFSVCNVTGAADDQYRRPSVECWSARL